MRITELQTKQSTRADEAFENFNFGTGVKIVESNGWHIDVNDGEDDFTKIAYAQFDDDEYEADSHCVSFHARFKLGTDELVESYGYDMESGNEIGVSVTISAQDLSDRGGMNDSSDPKISTDDTIKSRLVQRLSEEQTTSLQNVVKTLSEASLEDTWKGRLVQKLADAHKPSKRPRL